MTVEGLEEGVFSILRRYSRVYGGPESFSWGGHPGLPVSRESTVPQLGMALTSDLGSLVLCGKQAVGLS